MDLLLLRLDRNWLSGLAFEKQILYPNTFSNIIKYASFICTQLTPFHNFWIILKATKLVVLFCHLAGKNHISSVDHISAVAAADFYLSYCEKNSHKPTSLDESYIKAFLNQVSFSFFSQPVYFTGRAPKQQFQLHLSSELSYQVDLGV